MSEKHTEAETAGPFPAGAPDLWMVEAVPFVLEFVRQYSRCAEASPVATLQRLKQDLEAGEWTALDLVRQICEASAKRRELH
jgi:hypothetical protein